MKYLRDLNQVFVVVGVGEGRKGEGRRFIAMGIRADHILPQAADVILPQCPDVV
jgi:hypothetical protein